jgi:hypothetical protein
MRSIPKMPDEYKGAIKKNGGFTKTAPREWTSLEIAWVQSLLEQGFNCKEIAESIERSEVSTQIKIKRLSKKACTYNEEHIADKYQTNADFLTYIQPKTVIDVYAGERSFYSDFEVISNDKKENAETDFHLDALKFCCLMYCNDKKADVVDLDPFGSAFDCFDLAVKMAQKGLVITFGEMGHMRWKRLDYVRRYYGIERLEDFTLDALIEQVKAIGARNKKELIVYAKREWRNIGRVWFEVKPLKITEQWENKTDE